MIACIRLQCTMYTRLKRFKVLVLYVQYMAHQLLNIEGSVTYITWYMQQSILLVPGREFRYTLELNWIGPAWCYSTRAFVWIRINTSTRCFSGSSVGLGLLVWMLHVQRYMKCRLGFCRLWFWCSRLGLMTFLDYSSEWVYMRHAYIWPIASTAVNLCLTFPSLNVKTCHFLHV